MRSKSYHRKRHRNTSLTSAPNHKHRSRAPPKKLLSSGMRPIWSLIQREQINHAYDNPTQASCKPIFFLKPSCEPVECFFQLAVANSLSEQYFPLSAQCEYGNSEKIQQRLAVDLLHLSCPPHIDHSAVKIVLFRGSIKIQPVGVW